MLILLAGQGDTGVYSKRVLERWCGVIPNVWIGVVSEATGGWFCLKIIYLLHDMITQYKLTD